MYAVNRVHIKKSDIEYNLKPSDVARNYFFLQGQNQFTWTLKIIDKKILKSRYKSYYSR